MKHTILLTGLLACLGYAQAATMELGGITVVEADEFDASGSAGNTVFANIDPGTAVTTRSQGSFSDADTWKYRTAGSWGAVPAEFSAAYSSFGNGATDNANLTVTTSISGLANATYNVYAIYLGRTDGNDDGGIAAALTGDALVDYPDLVDTNTYADGFSLGVTGASDSNWEAYAVKIGEVTGTTISVDAGLLSTTDTGSGIQRNTYLGIGYSLASVPEPSSTALIGLAGLGFILRRRR
ncbi:PEP-CTERM protein-sorting domain-containing protein [Rubritalea squalenifaciens DSM 18772]|uniref:PEP-CTERM protein-sorting domain-containing protein n=2 Tax=Rubritalea TaxID=361050 RepID=A0A1M6BB62_9BACT|nr:PEP-CTERM sorting domain-containing protein [Rubritalea squalenifaciens]SHI45980.1 PEP-CTERM protein-sorting domain-containing protein [Rubritalea squalenifaciens DSM 18772]